MAQRQSVVSTCDTQAWRCVAIMRAKLWPSAMVLRGHQRPVAISCDRAPGAHWTGARADSRRAQRASRRYPRPSGPPHYGRAPQSLRTYRPRQERCSLRTSHSDDRAQSAENPAEHLAADGPHRSLVVLVWHHRCRRHRRRRGRSRVARARATPPAALRAAGLPGTNQTHETLVHVRALRTAWRRLSTFADVHTATRWRPRRRTRGRSSRRSTARARAAAACRPT